MMTVAQVLEHFSVPKTSLYRKMESGDLPFQKQGKKRLLNPGDVEVAFPQWNKRTVPPEQNGTPEGNVDLVESLRANIRNLELSNQDLRDRLTKSDEERSLVLRLLTDQRSSVDDPPPKKKKSTKGKKSKKGKRKKK